MKLKFYINSEGKKIYTINDKPDPNHTIEAHYKFVKIRDAPKKTIKKVYISGNN